MLATGYLPQQELIRRTLGTEVAAASLLAGSSRAQPGQPSQPIWIGALRDLGSPFVDVSGLGFVRAARMAAEDYRAQHGA